MMDSNCFWFAYGIDEKRETALRLYRYMNGSMERKMKDGSWRDAPEQCCIFFGEDMDYEDITEEEAESISVRF